jgi:hypothetical protein
VLLLVVRLLAVYFLTAAAAIFLANRFVSPIRARAGLFLAFAPFLLVGEALLTAGIHAPIDIHYQGPPLSAMAARMGTETTRTPLLSDVVFQEIPWRKAVREAAKNGRLPLWNRFVLAGEPLLAVQQPAVLHPGTWIGFLLPLAQAWTFEMALRYLLALLSAYLFLKDLRCGEIAALAGAVAWAFSDYIVFYLGYPLTPAAAPFPLLLLGLRRLVAQGGRRSVALVVVALLLILTSGHPETLLHSVAGAGVYFLFEVGFAGKGRRMRPVLLSLLAGALTLGLSAVLLLPLAEALPHTQEQFMRRGWYAHIRKSYPIRETLRHGASNAMPYIFGVSGKGEPLAGFSEPSSYVGTVLWPFAITGLFSRRREKWPLVALGTLGAAMGARVPGIADAVSAMPLFDIGLNDRMIFFTAFAGAGLAALGLEDSRERSSPRAVAIAAAAGAVILTSLYVLRTRWHMEALNMPPGYFRYRYLLQLLPLVLAAGLWLALQRSRRFGLAACMVLVLLLAQRRLEEGEIYPTYPSRAFYPPLHLLDAIPRNSPDRIAAVGHTFIPNIAALYELEDVRGYEAMTFKPLLETYGLWCVPQPIWFNRVDDPTRPFLSFLNARYVVAPPGYPPPEGWKILSRGEEGQLFENPRALPRAFTPRALHYEADSGRQVALLEGIRDFSNKGVVGESPPGGSPGIGARANGEASVRITSYEAQRIALEVDAVQAALVATSVTAWPGWKLTVDGAPAPLVPYNHAFLAFRVSRGRHTAVLRYWPDSFVAGGAISAAALAISVLLLTLRRGRAAEVPTMERAGP